MTDTPASLIAALQAKLIALGAALDTLPAREIEATAKSINALIGSLERAEGFLRTHDASSTADRLSPASREELLRKMQRMVDNGVLRGLPSE